MLNSNDFDFLQSRGACTFDLKDDPRDSLLLRFDPLTRRSILPTQFNSPVPVNEESDSDLSRTLTPSCSSIQTVVVDTNEPPSNGSLVQLTMDNETNSFINNVR